MKKGEEVFVCRYAMSITPKSQVYLGDFQFIGPDDATTHTLRMRLLPIQHNDELIIRRTALGIEINIIKYRSASLLQPMVESETLQERVNDILTYLREKDQETK